MAWGGGTGFLRGDAAFHYYEKRTGFRSGLHGNDYDRERKKCEGADPLYRKGAESYLCGGGRRAFPDRSCVLFCLYKRRPLPGDNGGRAGRAYCHGRGYADTAACKYRRHQRMCGGRENGRGYYISCCLAGRGGQIFKNTASGRARAGGRGA